jgi:uncharacterized protein (DUF169 family)
MISKLKSQFGSKCIGLKLNYSKEIAYSPIKSMRFCEAVNDAFKTTLIFNPSNLTCMGARRSMGLLNDDSELIEHISKESGISHQTIKRAIHDIPKMNTPIHNVLMGISEEEEKEIQPDMYILFVSPKDAMELMRVYTFKTDEFPEINPFTFLSICGSVFISTFKSSKMSVSFGCPESRKFGGIKDNLMVVGLPYNISKQLFD